MFIWFWVETYYSQGKMQRKDLQWADKDQQIRRNNFGNSESDEAEAGRNEGKSYLSHQFH